MAPLAHFSLILLNKVHHCHTTLIYLTFETNNRTALYTSHAHIGDHGRPVFADTRPSSKIAFKYALVIILGFIIDTDGIGT